MGAIFAQVSLALSVQPELPKLDEIQWHFYGIVTMIGISYA